MIDTPGPSLTAMSRNSAPCVIPCGSQLGSAGDLPWFATLLRYDVAGTLSCTGVWPCLGRPAPVFRYQALWSPPVSVFSTIGVRTACRVRLRVRAREIEPPTAS